MKSQGVNNECVTNSFSYFFSFASKIKEANVALMFFINYSLKQFDCATNVFLFYAVFSLVIWSCKEDIVSVRVLTVVV